VPDVHPNRHLWRARELASQQDPPTGSREVYSQCAPAASRDDEDGTFREAESSAAASSREDDSPDEVGEELALEFAAIAQRAPHRVFANEGFRASNDAETHNRLARISELDVPVLRRGREDDTLRSRDMDSTTFLARVNPEHLWFDGSEGGAAEPPEVSGLAKMHAEVRKLHDVVHREMAHPSGRRTVRFLGREMYLPGMAPTADDPIDFELLDYLWDISGNPGEGRADGFPAAPN
jgi:hypothetical protein